MYEIFQKRKILYKWKVVNDHMVGGELHDL